jgi:hypothetical protein
VIADDAARKLERCIRGAMKHPKKLCGEYLMIVCKGGTPPLRP